MEKISDNLKKYKKAELLDMLDTRGIKGVSKLDKEGLINKLVEYTLDQNNAWTSLLFLNDTEFATLVKIYKNKSISMKNISDYSTVTSILQTGYCYNEEDKLMMIDEARVALKPLMTQKNQDLHYKYHWVIECIDCADILYANYSINHVLALVQQKDEYKDVSEAELEAIISELPNDIIGFLYDSNTKTYSSTNYSDDELKEIVKLQEDKKYKLIQPELIHTLYSYDVILNEKYVTLASKLNDLIKNQDKASEITVNLNRVSLFGKDFKSFINDIIKNELSSLAMDDINSIVGLMADCYNNTPSVFNRGFSPAELSPMQSKPKAVNNNRTPFVNTKKIGRNDPCPCGSGKKYKKCCGAKQA